MKRNATKISNKDDEDIIFLPILAEYSPAKKIWLSYFNSKFYFLKIGNLIIF